MTVSIVSGKGGAGKTTISTAICHELSRSKCTLMIDLDFFNRGLYGLLTSHHRLSDEASICLPSVDRSVDHNWTLTKLSINKYFLALTSTKNSESLAEHQHVHELAEYLKALIAQASEACAAEAIVLDCHGGPDNLSFAASAVSDYSLLVSEPDRVTFYGTLHFLREAQQIVGTNNNIFLLFNKVPKTFSVAFLKRYYHNKIQRLFANKPVLGVIDHDESVSREFGNVPFVSALFPYSPMARGVSLLLRALFGERADRFLSQESRIYSYYGNIFRNLWGWRYRSFDPLYVARAAPMSVFLFLVLWIVETLAIARGVHSNNMLVSFYLVGFFGGQVALLALAWSAALMFLKWSFSIDELVTYFARARLYGRLALRGIYNCLWLSFSGAILGLGVPEFIAAIGDFQALADIVILLSQLAEISLTEAAIESMSRITIYSVYGVFFLVVLAVLGLFSLQLSRLLSALMSRACGGETVYRVVACLVMFGVLAFTAIAI